jgi:hypothetical protein
MDEQVQEAWAELLLDDCGRELAPDGVSVQYGSGFVNIWLTDTRGKLWSPFLDQPPGPCIAGDDPDDEEGYLACSCDHCAEDKSPSQWLYGKACRHAGDWYGPATWVQTFGRK